MSNSALVTNQTANHQNETEDAVARAASNVLAAEKALHEAYMTLYGAASHEGTKAYCLAQASRIYDRKWLLLSTLERHEGLLPAAR